MPLEKKQRPPVPPVELAQQTTVDVSPQYSVKAWLNSALGFKQKAEFAELEGDLETAWVNYLKHFEYAEGLLVSPTATMTTPSTHDDSIVMKVPKHRDWPKTEPARKTEHQHMVMDIRDSLAVKVERMKAQLEREFAEWKATHSVELLASPSSQKPLPGMPSPSGQHAQQLAQNQPQRKTPSLNELKAQQANAVLGPTATPAPQQKRSPSPPKVTPDIIETERLYKYLLLHATPPNILVLDMRPHHEFVRTHLHGFHLCNIDPVILQNHEGIIGSELEQLLRIFHSAPFHAQNFERRHEFDLVIYMDHSSTHVGQTPILSRIVQIIYDFELTKVLQRRPALVVGGWNAWVSTSKTSSVKVMDVIGFGDRDGRGVPADSSPPPPPPSSAVSSSGLPAALQIRRTTQDFVGQNSPLSASSPHQPSFSLDPALTSSQKPRSAEHPTSATSFENPYYQFNQVYDQEKKMLQQQATSGGNQQSFYPTHPQQDLSAALVPASLVGMSGPVASAPPMATNLPSRLEFPKPLTHPTPNQFQVQAARIPRAPSPSSPVGPAAVTRHFSQIEDSWTSHNAASVGRGLVGLKNLGNSCYMNSTLQCLLATKPLTAMFHDGSFRKYLNTRNPLSSEGKMAYAFAQLIHQAYREEHGVAISPSAFKEVIGQFSQQFRGSDQQDSQEFLAFLVDGLHEDLNQAIGVKGGAGFQMLSFPDWARPIPGREDDEDEGLKEHQAAEKYWIRYLNRNDSPIVQLFQGQLKSELKCVVCGKTSTTYNPFMYLSLPIPRNGSVRLQDCLQEFSREETLDEGDSWKCPRCKVPRRATKTLTISKLPPVLLIHLKRFSFNGPFRDKLDTYVDFPIRELDVFPFLSSSLKQEYVAYYDPATRKPRTPRLPQQYNLYAISNHYGGLNGGHYTACVRPSGRGSWYNFDDSRVTEVCAVGDVDAEQTRVKTRAAYSLFYVSMAAGGGSS